MKLVTVLCVLGLTMVFQMALGGCAAGPLPPIQPTSTLTPTVLPTRTVVPTQTRRAPTPTRTRVPAPPTARATVAPTLAVTWQRTQIAAAGLNVDTPSGWKRLGLEWAWARPQVDGQRIGINWATRKAGLEPTSLLPNHSVSLGATPVQVSWGTNAMSHTVEVLRPAAQGGGREAIERHILVLTGTRIYDFYASARTESDLAVLAAALEHLLQSVELG
jgi:hypothetical protein